jgi:hypothetical protein
MEKSTAEQVVDFLVEFVPDTLPKPFDSAAKAALFRLFGGKPLSRQKSATSFFARAFSFSNFIFCRKHLTQLQPGPHTT